MPCYEVRTQTVDMLKANPDILAGALRSMGAHSVTVLDGRVTGYLNGNQVSFQNGKLTMRGQSDSAMLRMSGQINKAYTGEAFKVAAKKAGFTVATNNKGQLVAERRRY